MTGEIYFDIPRKFTLKCIGIAYYTEHIKVHVWFILINIRIIFFKLYVWSFGNHVHVHIESHLTFHYKIKLLNLFNEEISRNCQN